jgi:NAD dependent epimerase/dehydratase family enzyme
MLPIFRLGAGGRLGDGSQWWSFVSLEDEVRALVRMLEDDTLVGPVNVTAPVPQTNREIAAEMGRRLHRPAVIPVPAFALRIALGEFAGEVLASQRVAPKALLDAGFEFEHPTFAQAFEAALA